MKYYLCLDEKHFTYICGRCGAEGFTIKKAGCVENDGGELVETLGRFIRDNGLKGRRITGSGVYSETICKELRLPAVSMSLTRQMIYNEIAYSRENSAPMVVDMDLLPSAENGKERRLLAYAIDQGQLEGITRDLRRTGLRCDRLLVLRDCMAKLAYWYRKDSAAAVMVELEETQVRLSLVKEGHCLLSRNIRLNVRHFCEENAMEFLYEELADQISRLMQFYSRRNEADTVKRIIMMPSGITDAGCGAELLQDILEIPVDCLAPEIEYAQGIEPLDLPVYGRVLAVCAADQQYPRRKTPDMFRARNRALLFKGGLIPAGRAARLLLLAGINAAVVMGLWMYARVNVLDTMRLIRENEAYMQEGNRQAQYQGYLEQEKNAAERGNMERDMERQERLLRETNRLSMADYRAVADCLAADMRLESMIYSRQAGTLDMVISMSGPERVPVLMEQVRLSGHFPDVRHRQWHYEQDVWGNDRLYLDISAVLEAKEAADEQAQ